jgi:DNA-binding CsgD family transcriptional regulator
MAMPVQLGGRAPTPAPHARELVATLEAALRIARDLLAMAEATGSAPTRLVRVPGERCLVRQRTGAAAPTVACPPATEASTAASQPPVGHRRLTEREVEVLRLIAAGLSNREMAVALCRSERTVERHLENIYRKIGAHSKADATAFAFRHHLA